MVYFAPSKLLDLMPRDNYFFYLLPLLLVTFNLLAQDSQTSTQSAPNIVIIIADDLGWNDVGFHNSKLHTPNIDRIAEEGIVLDRFYVSPICTPTRAALMSGKYPGRMGLNKGVIRPNRRIGLPPEETTLPEMLGEAGYTKRACIGKWHLGHSNVKYHPLNQGFTQFYGHYGGMVNYFTHKRRNQLDWHRDFESSYDEGYTTDLIATESVRFIESCVVEGDPYSLDEDSAQGAPFFLYVSFNAPHSPLQAKEYELKRNGYDKEKSIFLQKGETINDNNSFFQGRGNNKRQTFCAMIANLDQNVGRILSALEEQGFMENTIVLFMSDNGGAYAEGGSNIPLRGGKGQVYEGGVRSAAAIMWKNGGWVGGEVINDVMGHIDLFPTFQAIVNQNNKKDKSEIDGQDVSRVIDRKESVDKDREFYLGRAGFISGKWKYAHDGLFNIEEDPGEKKDLSNQFPNEFQKMKKRMIELREEVELKVKLNEDFPVQPEWRMPE